MDDILYIHSTVDGYFGCFYFLGIMNNSPLNIGVHIFVWTYVSFLLGIYLRMELQVTW